MTNIQQKYDTTNNIPLSPNYSFPLNSGSQQPIDIPTDTRNNTNHPSGLDHSQRNQKRYSATLVRVLVLNPITFPTMCLLMIRIQTAAIRLFNNLLTNYSIAGLGHGIHG